MANDLVSPYDVSEKTVSPSRSCAPRHAMMAFFVSCCGVVSDVVSDVGLQVRCDHSITVIEAIYGYRNDANTGVRYNRGVKDVFGSRDCPQAAKGAG